MRPLSAKQRAAMTARGMCPVCKEVRSYVVHRMCQEYADDESGSGSLSSSGGPACGVGGCPVHRTRCQSVRKGARASACRAGCTV